MNDLIKMDLQFFAEQPQPADADETARDEEVQEEKTLTQDEVNRLISQQKSKAKDEALKEAEKDYQDKLDSAVQQAISDYEAKSKMNADELAEYKAKEAQEKHQKELQDAQAKIDELTRINQQRQIKDESVTKLNELNIPVTETTLSLVSAGSLDDMSERAGLLAQFANSLKNEYSTATEPSTSGKNNFSSGTAKSRRDLFESANIIKNKK